MDEELKKYMKDQFNQPIFRYSVYISIYHSLDTSWCLCDMTYLQRIFLIQRVVDDYVKIHYRDSMELSMEDWLMQPEILEKVKNMLEERFRLEGYTYGLW